MPMSRLTLSTLVLSVALWCPAQPSFAKDQAQGQEPGIVHTFTDDAELKAFSELWQQRQGILLRMSVLRAYLKEEQAALDELNGSLASKYGLDLNKNYVYDSARKAIVEAPGPAPQAR